MGITGLIPFLEKASGRFHLRDFRGQCVAIDSYCWLHKGAFACADKLARGEPTDVHIQYCLKYVNMLLSYDIKPILVFDGRHLPAKAATEAKRRESRDSSKKRAAELLRIGKTEEARSYLRRCVDITHEMALQLIQECRKRNVDCVVAPYEADAQLAYLNKKGIAQAVITEDSDLMLFGCNKVLFKLDLTGSGLIIEAEKLYLAMGCKEKKYTFDKFRYMCILSGCDYLESLPGIGLAKARKFVLTTEDTDIRRALTKIPAYLNMRQLEVSDEYKMNFLKADATFKHMVVYDPVERKQVRLNDPGEMGTDPELCCNAGTLLEEETAFELALGNVDPFSMKRLDNWHPDDPDWQATGGQTSNWKQSAVTKHPSIWQGSSYEGRKSTRITISESVTTVRNAFKVDSVRRPAPNPEFEEFEKNESIDDVLQSYGIEPKERQQPPLKRLCLTSTTTVQQQQQRKTIDFNQVQDSEDRAEREKSPPRRNPFQVTSTTSITINRRSTESNRLTSPIKINPENSSLLRQVSPVKKVEFDSRPTLQIRTKMEKLSRFKRTVIASDGQKVISRFFSASCSSQQVVTTVINSDDESPQQQEQEETSPPQTVNVYLLSPEARGEKTPKKQRPSPHSGASCSPAPPVKGERSVEKLDSGFVEDSVVEGLSSSQKENESSQVKPSSRLALFVKKDPKRVGVADDTGKGDLAEGKTEEADIVEIKDDDDDDERDVVAVPKKISPSRGRVAFTSQNGSQKKSTCRRVGLSRNKSSKDVGPTQSKLSMFGFQKNPTGGRPSGTSEYYPEGKYHTASEAGRTSLSLNGQLWTNEIVETMSYTENVANFMEYSVGEQDSGVSISDLEMVAPEAIQQVRSRPNSPLASRDTSPARASPLTPSPITVAELPLTNGYHPSSSTVVKPAPLTNGYYRYQNGTGSDLSDDEYIDTVDDSESESTFRPIESASVHMSRSRLSQSSAAGGGDRELYHSINSSSTMAGGVSAEVAAQLTRAIERLNASVQQVNNRINVVEQSVAGLRNAHQQQQVSQRLTAKQFPPWWPFQDISPRLLAFIILWPLVVARMSTWLQRRK